MTSQLQGEVLNDNINGAVLALAMVGDHIADVRDPLLRLRVMEALGRAAGALLEVHGLVTEDDVTAHEVSLSIVPDVSVITTPVEVVTVDTSDMNESASTGTDLSETLGAQAVIASSVVLNGPVSPDGSETSDLPAEAVQDALSDEAERDAHVATHETGHSDTADAAVALYGPRMSRTVSRDELLRAAFLANAGTPRSSSELGVVLDPNGALTPSARSLAVRTFVQKYGHEMGIQRSGVKKHTRYWVDASPESTVAEAVCASAEGIVSELDSTVTQSTNGEETEIGKPQTPTELELVDVMQPELVGEKEESAVETAVFGVVEYALTDWGLAIVKDSEGRKLIYLGDSQTPLRLGDAAVMALYDLAENPHGLYFSQLRRLLEERIGLDISPGKITAVVSEIKNELAVYSQGHQFEIKEDYDTRAKRRSTHYRLGGAGLQYAAGDESIDVYSQGDTLVYSSQT